MPERGPHKGDVAVEAKDDRRHPGIGAYARDRPRLGGLQLHSGIERIVLVGALADRAAGQRALNPRQRLVDGPDRLDPRREGAEADPGCSEPDRRRSQGARLRISNLRIFAQGHGQVTQPHDRLARQVGGLGHQQPVVETLRHEEPVSRAAPRGPEDPLGEPDEVRARGRDVAGVGRGGAPAAATKGLRVEFPGLLKSTQKRGRHSGWSRGPGSCALAQRLHLGR